MACEFSNVFGKCCINGPSESSRQRLRCVTDKCQSRSALCAYAAADPRGGVTTAFCSQDTILLKFHCEELVSVISSKLRSWGWACSTVAEHLTSTGSILSTT